MRASTRSALLAALLLISPSAGAYEKLDWALETALGIPTTLPFSTFDYTLISTLPQPLVLGTAVGCQGEEWYCSGFRAYADIGFLRFPFTSATRSISMFSFETGVRYTPWAGPLFAALGFGLRRNSVNADLNTLKIANDVQATDADLNLFSLYAAPEIGAQFSLGGSWSMAVACGAQYSLHSSGSMMFYDRNSGKDSNSDPNLATESSNYIDRIAGILILRTAIRFTYAF